MNVLYAVSLNDLGQVYRLRRTTPSTLVHFTSNLFTLKSAFYIYYYSFYTKRILNNWRSHTSFTLLRCFELRHKRIREYLQFRESLI